MKLRIFLLFILSFQIVTGFAHPNNIKTSLKSQFGFEENKGQVTGEDALRVKFLHKAGNLTMFLLDNGIAYQFNRTHYPEGYKPLNKLVGPEERAKQEALAKDVRLETYRMDVTIVGANPNAVITTEGESADYVQYYNYDVLEVHSYAKVIYHDFYPNIDWVVYQKDGNIKYDFIIRPGGDPSSIKLQTHWAENIEVNNEGSLVLESSMGSVREKRPVSFQNSKEIETQFVLKDGILSFALSAYDKNQALIIDPSLQWATYYGGTGDDYGESCSVDKFGNVYLAGYTPSATNIASGGHQNSYGGGTPYGGDAFLAKFDSTGVRQWATYYGGGANEYSYCCTTDGYGNVYLSGSTYSQNNIAFNGYQNLHGGTKDGFLVKFNAAGVRKWATYYGGSLNEEGLSCTTDKQGNVYLCGITESNTGISFNGYQNTFGGGQWDGYLVKFDSSGVRQWATYYGGSDNDYGNGCATDAIGNLYLAGQSLSTGSIASGGHQNNFAGGSWDAFLVKFDKMGARQWATYYGGDSYDAASTCIIDKWGNIYLSGTTGSHTGISFNGHQDSITGSWDAFLAKFNSLGVRVWATYYGGSISDEGMSCSLDAVDNIYLVGFTSSPDSISYIGVQDTLGGQTDAYLVKFNANGKRLWGTYYGGSNNDYGSASAIVGSQRIYLAGMTASLSNIAYSGHQNSYGGGLPFGGDGFLVCLTDSSSVTTIDGVSVDDDFSIYPNPANKVLHIDGADGTEVSIFSIAGKLMGRLCAVKNQMVDISNYTPGTYYVRTLHKARKFIKY